MYLWDDTAVRCRFPIESRGRRKKLREVGCVTAICAACFTLRAVIVAWSAIDSADADLVCLPTLQISLPCAGAVGCIICLIMVIVSASCTTPCEAHAASPILVSKSL